MNGRNKGKSGEREAARVIAEAFAVAMRRGQQYAGGNQSPDIIGLKGIHVEVKRVEAMSLYNWIDQAQRDHTPGEVPMVLHRKNKREWLVSIKLEYLPALVKVLSKILEEGDARDCVEVHD